MARRGLLLDRDGVINVDYGYVGHRDKFEFMPGLFDLLRTAQDWGYRLAILTNQSGVARGLYTAEAYHELNKWMVQEFAHEGITIDLTLACFEHPDAADALYKRESYWRKPNPGMILEAMRRLDLDAKKSICVGDQLRDLEAARAGGIATCLWLASMEVKAPTGINIVKDFAGVRALLKV